MSASFKRIDYSLRPAKHAERRMLCDVFRRLRPFGRIEEYVYVGFGSVWFSDFSLFHRSLGIKDMISIEQSKSAEQRINDNKPFRIHVDFRKSTAALPELDWARNQVLWLDYDDPLSPDMLLDMRTVAQRAGSGTVLAVSVQCSQARQVAETDQNNPSAIARFVNAFGRERIPTSTAEDDLYGWPFGILSRSIVLQEVEAELAVRNASNPGNEVQFKTICEIDYEDGAKMTTLVGIFYSATDLSLLEECHFNTLDFLAPETTSVRILVPKLTVREFKRLESQLPLKEGASLELGSIPASEARRFSNMYRYLPNFAVLEG
ncbi:MAG: O-methyltransferase [Nitrosomonas ureae]